MKMVGCFLADFSRLRIGGQEYVCRHSGNPWSVWVGAFLTDDEGREIYGAIIADVQVGSTYPIQTTCRIGVKLESDDPIGDDVIAELARWADRRNRLMNRNSGY